MKTKATSILLIYTGGTIGMVKDYDSGNLKAFNFKKLLSKIPELKQLDCTIDTISFDKPIDSSNMNLGHWVDISIMIEDRYDGYEGFVVLHGSDTMSYSASALSFMLENLSKPVIFTGSQLPIGDLRTDAKENLITSIQIAATQERGRPAVQEVCVYFEYKLFRGNRTTKINAEHFEAFQSLNYPLLAESGVHLKIYKENLLPKGRSKKLRVHKTFDNNVGILKMFPGITTSFVEGILKCKGLKALIIETYGAGNAPTSNWFTNSLKNALKQGLIIVNVTQCAGGSVAMGQYETSQHLKKLQIINGKDITTEAAITKMMYLLGSKVSPASLKTIFETALRGEME